MKNTLSILFFALFFSLTYVSVSQETNTLGQNEFFMMHYYTFEGNATQDKLDELEKALLKLEFVSEAKVKYKFEKSMGQISLVVKEREIVHEGDKTFSPAAIKQTIIKNGFSPLEYSTGKYERK